MRRQLERLGVAVTAYQVAIALREHWLSIPRAKRDRTAQLVTRSRGRPSNLTQIEQAELRQLIAGMDLPVLGRRLAAVAVAKRRGRRR